MCLSSLTMLPGLSLEESLSFEESGSAVIPEGAFDLEAPAAQWQPPSAEEPAAPAIDINELSAEAEFYYQQGLFDEARQHYEKILEQEPNNQGARDRLAELSREKEEIQEFSKLAEAVEGLESAIPSEASGGELALSASDEEAVRSLMQDLKQLQPEEKGAHDEFPAFGAPAGEELDSSVASLGSGGDEFFDLAAELKEELGSIHPGRDRRLRRPPGRRRHEGRQGRRKGPAGRQALRRPGRRRDLVPVQRLRRSGSPQSTQRTQREATD